MSVRDREREARGMKTLLLLVVAGTLLVNPVQAQGQDGSSPRHYTATTKGEGLRVSFVVREGKVRRVILDIRQVPCTSPAGRTRVSAYLGGDEIRNGGFETRYQEQFDNFMVNGTVSRRNVAGTASVAQRDNKTVCRSGRIQWEAEWVPFREWKDFRDIYD